MLQIVYWCGTGKSTTTTTTKHPTVARERGRESWMECLEHSINLIHVLFVIIRKINYVSGKDVIVCACGVETDANKKAATCRFVLSEGSLMSSVFKWHCYCYYWGLSKFIVYHIVPDIKWEKGRLKEHLIRVEIKLALFFHKICLSHQILIENVNMRTKIRLQLISGSQFFYFRQTFR